MDCEIVTQFDLTALVFGEHVVDFAFAHVGVKVLNRIDRKSNQGRGVSASLDDPGVSLQFLEQRRVSKVIRMLGPRSQPASHPIKVGDLGRKRYLEARNLLPSGCLRKGSARLAPEVVFGVNKA